MLWQSIIVTVGMLAAFQPREGWSDSEILLLEKETAHLVSALALEPYKDVAPQELMPPRLPSNVVWDHLTLMARRLREESAAYKRLACAPEAERQAVIRQLILAADKTHLQIVGVVAQAAGARELTLDTAVRALMVSEDPLGMSLVCNVATADTPERVVLAIARQLPLCNPSVANVVQLFGIGVFPRGEQLVKWLEAVQGLERERGALAWLVLYHRDVFAELQERAGVVVERYRGKDGWGGVVWVTYGSPGAEELCGEIAKACAWVPECDGQQQLHQRMLDELVLRKTEEIGGCMKQREFDIPQAMRDRVAALLEQRRR